ncbi:hypothetical protein PYH37_005873 (plasmid) [Sinorhizobium numidicum]|uniref:Uncharacterized protein n=1 Tax=Sinorhizobium numidicum TaxID=680248 RepID=A0ABY8D3R7_9HYPH|nr:hypothetical protein [Sinorhizobium numidicum]WEX79530.1 hypothetical protein PYH37_005873 [Sinorhizobium numidicum]WEX85516.1 hypothetical protein PYH38_005914 [Sinorhizobium numidicum]
MIEDAADALRRNLTEEAFDPHGSGGDEVGMKSILKRRVDTQ